MILPTEDLDRKADGNSSMPRHLLLKCPVVDISGLDFEIWAEFWETIIEGVFQARIQSKMLLIPNDRLREDLQNQLVSALDYSNVVVVNILEMDELELAYALRLRWLLQQQA